MENPIEKRRATEQVLRNFVEKVLADKLSGEGLDSMPGEMPDTELLEAIKNFSLDDRKGERMNAVQASV